MIDFGNLDHRSRTRKQDKRRFLQEIRHIQYKFNTSEIETADKFNIICELMKKGEPRTTDAAVLKMMITTFFELRDFFIWLNKYPDIFTKLNQEFKHKNVLCKTKYHSLVFKTSDIVKIKRPFYVNIPNNLSSTYLNDNELDAAKTPGEEFNKSMILFYSLVVGSEQLKKDFAMFNDERYRDNDNKNESV